MRTPESTRRRRPDARQHPSKATDRRTASPCARRRNTRERVLVAGCGGSSPSPPATASSRRAAPDHHWVEHRNRRGRDELGLDRASAAGSGPLAFAKCMRANGVPNFPDPNPGGDGCSPSLGSTRHRPRSGRRRRSARSSWAAAPRPRLDDAPLPTDAGEAASGSRGACASTGIPSSRPQDDRPVPPRRHQRDNRFRRSDPSASRAR